MGTNAVAFTDGGGAAGYSCACATFIEIEGEAWEVAEKLDECTNNEAEYRGVLLAMRFALEKGVTRMTVYSDSSLIVNQINGVYQSRHPVMKILLAEVLSQISLFDHFKISWVPRRENKRADALCRKVKNHPSAGFAWKHVPREFYRTPRKRPIPPRPQLLEKKMSAVTQKRESKKYWNFSGARSAEDF